MVLVVVPLLLSLLMLVAVLLARKRRRVPLPFKIMVIGSKSCGKSVFIATAFNEMRTPDAGGISLETPEDTRNELLRTFRRIADTRSPFPPGTPPAGVVYPFTLVARDEDRNHEIVRFDYPEYDGENIRAMYLSRSPELVAFEQEIKAADVLVGFIDGQRIRDCLVGGDASEFREELHDIIHTMTFGRGPAHLVVTKWDTLFVRRLGGNEQLERVVEYLREIDFFRNFVTTAARNNRTVRIIPVSAVGMRFVHEVNGQTRKRAGASLEPYLVRTPLACALLDLLEHESQYPRNSGRPSGTTVIDLLASLPISLSFGPLHLSTSLRELAPRAASHEVAESRRVARNVYYYLQNVAGELQNDFPCSNLSRRAGR